MGTKERRMREKKRRRQQILEAAKTHFFEKGFMAATMDKIADSVELSKGTLYLYFKSKEELSDAIEEGIAAGDIRQQDPMSLAVVLWGSLTGIILLHEGKDHRKFMPYPIERLVEQNIEMSVHGLTSV